MVCEWPNDGKFVLVSMCVQATVTLTVSRSLIVTHSHSHSRSVLVSWSRSFGRWDSRGHTRLLSLSDTHCGSLTCSPSRAQNLFYRLTVSLTVTPSLNVSQSHSPDVSFAVSHRLVPSLDLSNDRSIGTEPTTIERIGARNTRQERDRENQCVP